MTQGPADPVGERSNLDLARCNRLFGRCMNRVFAVQAIAAAAAVEAAAAARAWQAAARLPVPASTAA